MSYQFYRNIGESEVAPNNFIAPEIAKALLKSFRFEDLCQRLSVVKPEALQSILSDVRTVEFERFKRYFVDLSTGSVIPTQTDKSRYVFLNTAGQNVATMFYQVLGRDMATQLGNVVPGARLYAAGSLVADQATFPISGRLKPPEGYSWDPMDKAYVTKRVGIAKIDPITDLDLVVSGIDRATFRDNAQPFLVNLYGAINEALPPELCLEGDGLSLFQEDVSQNSVALLKPFNV